MTTAPRRRNHAASGTQALRVGSITTVSATYAQEITTPAFGCGLDGFLASKTQQGLLSGIPNGIDESWDAATDPHLFCPFSIGDWDGKAVNAAHVRELGQCGAATAANSRR